VSGAGEPGGLELRLPAAALRLWIEAPPAVVKRVRALAAKAADTFAVDDGLWVVTPGPGRPAVFDRAVSLAGHLLAALVAQLGPGRSRVLVLPASVEVGPAGQRLLEDPLLEELGARAPRLTPDVVHVTTHAALSLEGRRTTVPAGQLEGRSGRVVPLVTVGAPAPDQPPWRNPTVLTRAQRWVPLDAPAAALRELASGPAVRLTGALGTGKTRLAWEVLRASERRALWRQTGLAPAEPLAELLARERERPLWLVYDGLESAEAGTWQEIASLLGRGDPGQGVHLLLIARPHPGWPAELATLPEVELTPLAGEEWEHVGAQLFHGLSLPAPVAERLAAGAAGVPFALEEALVHLVRDRQLRQVFGSFFFSGEEAVGRFAPSPRFRLHAEAEAARLGDPTPLRLAALAGVPVPAPELRAAAFALGGSPVGPEWEAAFAAGRQVETATGPWGEGLRPASPATAQALVAALPEATAARARLALGELLAARSGTAVELWAAWPLVAGTDDGARAVLAAVRARGGAGRDDQFAALRSELATLADRRGDPELELELLWALLPLARRLGRLHELERAIERGLALAEKHTERFVAIAAVAAELAQKEGRLRDAETILRRALAAARDVDARRKELLVVELGRVLVLLGRKPEARELFETSRQIAERSGRTGVAALSLFLLGNLALHELDFAAARDLHERALALRRRARNPSATSASLSALGAVALAEGNLPRAIESYEEARQVLDGEGADVEESWALLGLGRALTRLGDTAGAMPVLRRALTLREGRDDARGEAIARAALAAGLLGLGQLEAAHAEARKAHFALALLPESEARAEAERVLGEILLRQRRPAEAVVHFVEAERMFRAVGYEMALPEVLADRLEATMGIGRVEGVRAAWSALAEERGRRPVAPSAATCDFRLFLAAEWLSRKGQEVEKPMPFLERAYAELMRQTGYLAPELRQRFLFQIAEHQALVEAATRRGLGTPPGGAPGPG
jgi:tetratricopeptide (TPR) repeat protein